jgi:hypothetical protein
MQTSERVMRNKETGGDTTVDETKEEVIYRIEIPANRCGIYPQAQGAQAQRLLLPRASERERETERERERERERRRETERD